MDTVCETIRDYCTDYERLRPHIRFLVLNEIHYKVVGEYIIAMDSRFLSTLVLIRFFIFRRLTYSNYRERQLAAERIKTETLRIERLFEALSSNTDYPVR